MRIFGRRFIEDRCVQIASSLTFTTLLALVPIVTVALTVVSAFPVFESLIGHLQRFLMNNMLPESVSAITTYTAQFSENTTQLTAVGIAFVAVTALMLMITIDGAFNDIWRVSRPRSLLQRILVYWTVLTIGPLFVGASLSLTSYLIRLSLGLIDDPPGVGLLLLRFVSLLLTSVALALLYWTVPNRPVLKRDALLGGVSRRRLPRSDETGLQFLYRAFSDLQAGLRRVCRGADFPALDLPVVADRHRRRGAGRGAARMARTRRAIRGRCRAAIFSMHCRC